VSFTFGPDVVSRFLQKHDMDLICRAHQVVEDGYEFFSKRQLVTLFSAPNYCGEFDNAGAMMSVDESLLCSFQVRFSFSNSFLFKRKALSIYVSVHCCIRLTRSPFSFLLPFFLLSPKCIRSFGAEPFFLWHHAHIILSRPLSKKHNPNFLRLPLRLFP
jgi:hypothetical protein